MWMFVRTKLTFSAVPNRCLSHCSSPLVGIENNSFLYSEWSLRQAGWCPRQKCIMTCRSRCTSSVEAKGECWPHAIDEPYIPRRKHNTCRWGRPSTLASLLFCSRKKLEDQLKKMSNIRCALGTSFNGVYLYQMHCDILLLKSQKFSSFLIQLCILLFATFSRIDDARMTYSLFQFSEREMATFASISVWNDGELAIFPRQMSTFCHGDKSMTREHNFVFVWIFES